MYFSDSHSIRLLKFLEFDETNLTDDQQREISYLNMISNMQYRKRQGNSNVV